MTGSSIPAAEASRAAAFAACDLDTFDVDEDEFSDNVAELDSGLAALASDEESEDEGGDPWLAAAAAEWDQVQIDELHAQLREIGMINFLRKYLRLERDSPGYSARQLLLAFGVLVPVSAEDDSNLRYVQMLKVTILRILRRRERRTDVSTLEDALRQIKTARNIIILSGAGVSTSCGIPDFRSSDGIYAKLRDEGAYELDEPQQMFDLQFFRHNPQVFYSFAHSLYPSNFLPSRTHSFIRLLEKHGKLLRNYTQNIDTLEQRAGIKRVLNCHGSFATASCMRCRRAFPGEAIKEDVFAKRVPLCPYCTADDEAHTEEPSPPAKKRKTDGQALNWRADAHEEDDEEEEHNPWLSKPILRFDICLFGEPLPDEFDLCLAKDREKIDLLIVIGSSLSVAPVSELTAHIPHSVPQILINRDPTPHVNFDVCLLGDCDVVVSWLCDQLAKAGSEDIWRLPSAEEPRAVDTDVEVPNKPEEHVSSVEALASASSLASVEDVVAAPLAPSSEPQRIADTHFYAFSGANLDHPFIKRLRRGSKSSSPSPTSETPTPQPEVATEQETE
ncbi:uncharacterized protein L969DRAFT_48203 [Mixia osmundae IAM 14324]|uniref:Deacetylase sirtuin-type domain-containing protein n=1 Tax=Mixia osmundae (strain CBS 9802 / IAM 14324 / JCM 22182 / KY 12970) TaxID=764103 RepID=G7E9G8_MIXOS|nr:uncharacterized protein L969DRAFT_48203 [Mixia osmundae IAM 14324]KEI39920.1 hypothetical protein L969DRAFT_48203 [Mixia osmundae IAM 14324]GAA99287.1 hypothetical protein E5Q_05982 [Mixia osmundae IAM 14324]